MEMYGGSQSDQQPEWVPVGPETGLEESMRRLGLWSNEGYPERSGTPNCSFYMRTGSCGYGAQCRYNHPPDLTSVGVVPLERSEYPERIGEPICQYYLRTATCKYGASCKFHHPRNLGGSLSNVPLNEYGYPLRPEERVCSYYLKTGQCKFGLTCKFHHPNPAEVSAPVTAQPFYPTVPSLPAPLEETRPQLLPSSYVPGTYGPVLLHPGLATVQNWSTYSAPGSLALSQLASSTPAIAAPYSSLHSAAGPSSSALQEKHFPERPGQRVCQYYMQTGDCKFGSSCKFHHPADWSPSKTDCAVNSLGLPLRPGVQPCSFYMQRGFCKFGGTCKFDHPMGTVRDSSSASSLPDIPNAPYMSSPE
ncbi:Zinc finger CCCH domain-containing protein 32 [Capsicum baccatum]|uniref:Zinc finger CCCH domain-containing protein 32 n=1 Tax=Capsicum baccatum TaxID=33114 RepID=A0A2G2WGV7_CAPBA|nr:Zinc finger CCCH domain-containing protein 32 [Capsicum baccatum]